MSSTFKDQSNDAPTVVYRGGSILYFTMEIKIKSKSKKGRHIYGILSRNKKATTLVVFLSGFSGSKELPLFKKASKEFLHNNFSTLRLNFCRDHDDKYQKNGTLKPEDLSLSVYISELKNIIDTLGKDYLNIILVGHSFGAVISILFLDKYKKYRKNTELILWDPTLLPWKKKTMKTDFLFNPKRGLYYGRKTKEIMNKVFYKECLSIKNTAITLRALNKGVCIIAAEHGGGQDARKYFLKINDRKNSKLFIIKNTGHCFESKKAQKELFDRTIKFLNIK